MVRGASNGERSVVTLIGSGVLKPPRIHDFVPNAFGDDLIEVQPLDEAHPVRRMGLHGHAFGELMLVTGGEGHHRVNGRSFRAARGRLFVLAPGDVHDCGALRSAVGWLLLVRIEALAPHVPRGRAASPDDVLLRCFGSRVASRQIVIAFDEAACTAWEHALGGLADELAARRPHHRAAVEAATRLLLVDLARRLPFDDAWSADRGAQRTVARALAYIDAHCLDDIAPQDVATYVARTSAYLTTALRQRTGRTLGEWIVEHRMAEARRLLVTTDLSIAEIAERVRYSDAEGFARAFRRLHRAPPGAWRRLHR